MKNKFLKNISLLILICLTLGLTGCKENTESESLTIFSQGDYIDPEVLSLFTKETGIKVKCEEAITPEEMYTKYKSGAINYDLICSCDYMIQKLIGENSLQKINMEELENSKNIGKDYFELASNFDPNNEYAVPYFWGTLGILYNTKMVEEPIDSWDALFSGKYAGQIIMQNSMRDIYMTALKYLGYSINTTNKDELREAQELLLKQKSDVQAYLVDEARDELVAENAALAVVYSGEAYLGNQYNENLNYVIPKEGSNVWLDVWCITKECKNTDAAKKFLDFLCREDIAAKNFEYIYYSTPNTAVIDGLSEEDKNNSILVPDFNSIKNCEVCTQLDSDTTSFLNDLWKELKSN